MRCLCAVARVLLNAGADVGSRDNDGWTPLHAAAHWGQTESCEILAQNFASFKAIDSAVCVGCLTLQCIICVGRHQELHPACQSVPVQTEPLPLLVLGLTPLFCFSFLSSWSFYLGFF